MCPDQADPVLVDIEEVCQVADEATAEEPAEAPTQVREDLCFGKKDFVCVILFALLCFSVKLFSFIFVCSRPIPCFF